MRSVQLPLIYIALNDPLQRVMRSTDGDEAFDFYSERLRSTLQIRKSKNGAQERST